jgi:chorismate mutase
MNNAQTGSSKTNEVYLESDISDVRRHIDAIDSELANLIARRCALSVAVAGAKRAGGDHSFGWRPAREIKILRHILAQETSLDPELAFHVWRALISANLAAQGAFGIVAIEETLQAAQMAFSVSCAPVLTTSAISLLQALLRDEHTIGVLPWPTQSDWWVSMMQPQFDALYVCAASPVSGRDPDCLLLAARSPEAAGGDISLVAGPIGAFEGGVMAQEGGLELVAYGDFITPNTPLPSGCRLLGAFALV